MKTNKLHIQTKKAPQNAGNTLEGYILSATGKKPRAERAKPRHPESHLQRGCVKWFRLQYKPQARLLFAVPNGGRRNLREATILRSEGVTAGVADLLLLVARGGYNGLCIEMKTPKGRQSEEQRLWQQAAEAEGYRYIVCRSLEDFQFEVGGYMEGWFLRTK